MRIVTPEKSIENIEKIPFIKFIFHDFFGFRCEVLDASIYSRNCELEKKIKYSDCYLTLSRDIISLKNNKNYIWKVRVSLFEIKENNTISSISFVNKYEEKFSLKVKDKLGFLYFSSEDNIPIITLQLRDISFSKKVFNHFRDYPKTIAAPKKTLFSALKTAEKELENESFDLIKVHFEKAIRKKAKTIMDTIQKNNSTPLAWIYGITSNISGNMVESGNYHIYRGVLNEEGQRLLKLFDDSTNKLLDMGMIEKNYATNQKNTIRENIKGVG